MSGQRARPVVSAAHRSVHPNVPGIPWWGAVLVAATATAIGFAFDAGSDADDLTGAFAAMYVIGCIAAVLIVRQASIFTAVMQPPVILFISVPGAYYLFNKAETIGLKDILINCGYPLIERFPLMAFTSAAVLAIGVIRWLVGGRATADTEEAADRTVERAEKASAVDAPKKTTPPPRPRPSRRPAAEHVEPLPERPRRPRSAPPPPADRPAEPRRRATASWPGRDPYERREHYERRVPHERRSRYDSYDPFEAYESPRRRGPGTNGSGATGTHHPISQVRYRGEVKEAESWEYDI